MSTATHDDTTKSGLGWRNTFRDITVSQVRQEVQGSRPDTSGALPIWQGSGPVISIAQLFFFKGQRNLGGQRSSVAKTKRSCDAEIKWYRFSSLLHFAGSILPLTLLIFVAFCLSTLRAVSCASRHMLKSTVWASISLQHFFRSWASGLPHSTIESEY